MGINKVGSHKRSELFEYVPDSVKKIVISVILATLSLGITNGIAMLVKNPELGVTVLEWNYPNENKSKIETLIQNTGVASENNILVYYATGEKYNLTSFKSTDGLPKIVNSSDNKLRISIDRLSPKSLAILTTEGKMNLKTNNTIWISSDKETTHVITLPIVSHSVGLTTTNFSEERRNAILIESGFGLLFIVMFRYLNYNRFDFLRRKYLGAYSLRLIRLNSKYFRRGIYILVIAFFVSAPVDFYGLPSYQQYITQFQSFNINENFSIIEFVMLDKPGTTFQPTIGNVILVGAIFIALGYSSLDARIPRVIWTLPSKLSDVKVSQIKSSFTPSEEVSLTTRKKIEDSEIEIFIVKNDDQIVGLVSLREILAMTIGKKPVFRTILRNKKLGEPKWDDDKLYRNNFIIVNDQMNLETLKKEMEKISKSFAVVINSENNVIGVIQYSKIFDKFIKHNKEEDEVT